MRQHQHLASIFKPQQNAPIFSYELGLGWQNLASGWGGLALPWKLQPHFALQISYGCVCQWSTSKRRRILCEDSFQTQPKHHAERNVSVDLSHFQYNRLRCNRHARCKCRRKKGPVCKPGLSANERMSVKLNVADHDPLMQRPPRSRRRPPPTLESSDHDLLDSSRSCLACFSAFLVSSLALAAGFKA